MKNNLLLLTFLVLINALPVHAQIQTHFGLWGGFNFANLHIDGLDEIIDFKVLTVWGLGAQIEIDLNNHFSVLFQPGYMQKGTKFKDVFEDIPPKIEVKINYLELPVLIKYRFHTGGIHPFLMAGESVGYLLNAETIRLDDASDLKNELKTFDFSLTFGAGFSYPIGEKEIFLEGRYSVGILDINDNVNEPDVKTKGLQLLTGISF